MKNFLMMMNNKGLANLAGKGFESAGFNEDAVVFLDMDTADKHRVLDFKNHFVSCTYEKGIVVGKDKILFEDGSLEKLKDIFSNVKQDSRRNVPQKGDFVSFRNCTIGEAFIASNMAVSVHSLKSDKGIVKDIEDGLFSVIIDGKLFKLPSIALKRLPKTIMSKRMREMYIFLMNKGKKPIISKEYNYMDITKDGKFIEYISNDRLARFENADYWNEELRQKFATKKKIRGVLKALFECTDDEMDSVIMIFGKSDLQVEVLEGEDILTVFDTEECSEDGSISQSCMLDKPENFFEVYKDNAKCAIVRNDDGEIILRAMIWELKSKTKRKKVQLLDRIYSSDDSLVPLLKNWAIKNGMYTLQKQAHSQTEMVSPRGEIIPIGDYHVKLVKSNYENYPYIDTMCIKIEDRLYAYGYVKIAHTTGGSLANSI